MLLSFQDAGKSENIVSDFVKEWNLSFRKLEAIFMSKKWEKYDHKSKKAML